MLRLWWLHIAVWLLLRSNAVLHDVAPPDGSVQPSAPGWGFTVCAS